MTGKRRPPEWGRQRMKELHRLYRDGNQLAALLAALGLVAKFQEPMPPWLHSALTECVMKCHNTKGRQRSIAAANRDRARALAVLEARDHGKSEENSYFEAAGALADSPYRGDADAMESSYKAWRKTEGAGLDRLLGVDDSKKAHRQILEMLKREGRGKK